MQQFQVCANDTSFRAITPKDIAVLWYHLANMFGYRFLKNYGARDEGTWFAVLSDLTNYEVAYGLYQLIKQYRQKQTTTNTLWPPNAYEFRCLCQPKHEDFNLKPCVAAFEEARSFVEAPEHHWSHLIVKIAAKQVGAAHLKNNTGASFQAFQYLYGVLSQQVLFAKPIVIAPAVKAKVRAILAARHQAKIPSAKPSQQAVQAIAHLQQLLKKIKEPGLC